MGNAHKYRTISKDLKTPLETAQKRKLSQQLSTLQVQLKQEKAQIQMLSQQLKTLQQQVQTFTQRPENIRIPSEASNVLVGKGAIAGPTGCTITGTTEGKKIS